MKCDVHGREAPCELCAERFAAALAGETSALKSDVPISDMPLTAFKTREELRQAVDEYVDKHAEIIKRSVIDDCRNDFRKQAAGFVNDPVYYCMERLFAEWLGEPDTVPVPEKYRGEETAPDDEPKAVTLASMDAVFDDKGLPPNVARDLMRMLKKP